MKKIRVGSRESKLAIVQSQYVIEHIKNFNADTQAELVTMKTTGDIILDKKLDEVGGKGLFTKELDIALLDGRTDISVHSLKDMPVMISSELPLIAFSEREDPRDVLILPAGQDELDFSKPIGCSSRRRLVQIKNLYPGALIKEIRGNVLTRLKKLDGGEYGALILAAAGIKRLGLEDRISRYFSVDEMIPASGQGVIVIQGKKGEDYQYLESYNNKESEYAAKCERAFVRALEGNCSSPIGAYAKIEHNNIVLRGLYYDEEKERCIADGVQGPVQEAEELGEQLAKQIKRTIGMKTGKVWLVGAGPGDAWLLTVKAKNVIEQAETVVYDRLVGQSILMMIPRNAKAIDVGKQAGNHTMPQEEINKLLLQEALEGKRVVRLKGGDPFLFGRGGEELELLARNNIPYEVVPGITSAISVPAYNGIPVTHRDYASSLHIITGHKKEGDVYDIDFAALVKAKGTLVFLMGARAVKEICAGLIGGGMDGNMPAALLEKGTTSRQRKIVATVSTLSDEAVKQHIGTPAIIVIGEVCGLSGEFSWFEKLPLYHCKIVVTRPKELNSTFSRKLKENGAEVLELPAIKLKPIKDNVRLLDAVTDIGKYQWLVLTSPSGADIFFEFLKDKRIDIRNLSKIRIAAVGSATAKKIEQRGLFTDLIPKVFDGKTLGEELNKLCNENDQILIPRALEGNREIIDEIGKNKKVHIEDIPTYETVYETKHILDLENEFKEEKIDLVVFTSSSIVRGFVQALKGVDLHTVHAVCIGRQTKETADKYGMNTYMSEKATIDCLVEKVIEVAGNKKKREKETC